MQFFFFIKGTKNLYSNPCFASIPNPQCDNCDANCSRAYTDSQTGKKEVVEFCCKIEIEKEGVYTIQ